MTDAALHLKRLANQGLRDIQLEYGTGCGGCVHAHWVGHPQRPEKGGTTYDHVEFHLGACQAGMTLERSRHGHLTPVHICTARMSRSEAKAAAPVEPPKRSEATAPLRFVPRPTP